MANVDAVADKLSPLGVESAVGRLVIGYINSATKAAQNDTVTVVNAASVEWVVPTIDATGAHEAYTISGNIITCTSATTGAVSGLVAYRER